MTPAAWMILAVAAGFAVATWISVGVSPAPSPERPASRRLVEYICKPPVMPLLIAMLLIAHPRSDAQRVFFVIGLLFALCGDVLLLIGRNLLLPGLLAFLGNQLAYIIGFRFAGFSVGGLLIGLLLMTVAATILLAPTTDALRRSGRRAMRNTVFVYTPAVSLMVISAWAGGNLFAAGGGLLYYCSDTLYGWYNFVAPLRWGRLANVIAYQSGQAALALSLFL